MAERFPLVGIGEGLDAVRAGLQESDALLVVEGGDPVGVLTRHDLLGYLAR
jgi:cystathionine beta-synthase